MGETKTGKGHGSGKQDAKQYAALCLRPDAVIDGHVEVLLITSRDSGRWVIPKGWPMAKKKPHQVARQEAWEEAGVRGRVRKQPFGSYRYAKKVSREGVLDCLVQVFLLTVSDIAEDFPERSQRRIKWFSPRDAAEAVAEPELCRLLGNLPVNVVLEQTCHAG